MADNKKYQNVDILAELAAKLPTQRPPEPARPAIVDLPRQQPAPAADPLVQISFSARASTRKAMFQIAHDRDMTLKAIILDALKKAHPALDITEADLIDKRR